MTKEKHLDPLRQKGSFAGAMGCVQQLPSVHHIYGVDFNGDGVKNLFDMEDCIGTIANFMQVNGWENGRVVTVRASYHDKRYEGLTTGFDKIYTIDELDKLCDGYISNRAEDYTLDPREFYLVSIICVSILK